MQWLSSWQCGTPASLLLMVCLNELECLSPVPCLRIILVSFETLTCLIFKLVIVLSIHSLDLHSTLYSSHVSQGNFRSMERGRIVYHELPTIKN